MKRVLIAALIVAAFFLALHRPASAMAEFCPATLNYQRVGPDTAKDQPGDLYGFNLSALGPRTISSAVLAFDTSAGWYTVEVPGMPISEKERHYSNPTVSFVRHDYVSPKLYVRFPRAVHIDHAWVYNAQALNDGPFGWMAQGDVICDPPAAASPEQATAFRNIVRPFYKLADVDSDGLSEPPTAKTITLPAAASKALESASCADPFREATVKHQAVPEYPSIMRGSGAGRSTVSVEVAIRADGTLADAWVWGPSGYKAFDDSALRSARISTYEGARAYCNAVPGRYFFRVTFDPNQ
jgi:TonB family protein